MGDTTVQAKLATVRPQAAALADAFSETFWPAATDAGSDNRGNRPLRGFDGTCGIRHAGAAGGGRAQALHELES